MLTFLLLKIKWIIENISGIKQKIIQGKIYMGNIDSWIIWNLSGGVWHVTDYSNASRTMLLNIHKLIWDMELLEMVGVPEDILPDLMPSSGIMATTAKIFIKGERIIKNV